MATKRKRHSIPLFVRVIMIITLMAATLTTIVAVSSDRIKRNIAEDGLRNLAAEVTGLVAMNISGAVRFGKVEAIEAALQGMTDESRKDFLAVAVLDAEGQVLISSNRAGPAELDLVNRQAALALQSGEPAVSENGFLVSFPVTFGEDNQVIGSISALWTSRHYMISLTETRNKQFLYSGLLLVASVLATAVFLQVTFRKPLAGIIARIEGLAGGDLHSEVPMTGHGSEIGLAARALDTLRTQLEQTETTRIEADLLSAGFIASSAAMVMADKDLNITHFNPAFQKLAHDHLDNIRYRLPHFDPEKLLGTSADVFHRNPEATRKRLSSVTFPHEANLQMGDAILSMNINALHDAQKNVSGYLVEWQDVTESRKTSAILQSLESAQLRADFHGDGHLESMNQAFASAFGFSRARMPELRLQDFLRQENGDTLGNRLTETQAIIGRFTARSAEGSRLLDGFLSPAADPDGKVNGHVFMGRDITDAEARLEAAAKENNRMALDQRKIVDALRQALQSLSDGDLSTRIGTEFAG